MLAAFNRHQLGPQWNKLKEIEVTVCGQLLESSALLVLIFLTLIFIYSNKFESKET